ncbi:cytochrome P450 [Winogradskya humida]|uniref:Cytochrome P450 n=1 Tax=Winogradskya humida TaxID=113566 RepID=A0ABQ4A144_9ACTN|nr:cytochrome P450 [Actinoplanes humidus]GIE24580.1 cytochrome P450 [Actinoplanes humidus]
MTDTLLTPALAPGARPLLGHGLAMKKNPGDLLIGLQSGDPVTMIRLGRTPMYVINTADLMRAVMRQPEIFGRGGPIAERFRTMFGNGLGISEGEFHRRQRAIIQPAFHRRRIEHYCTIMGDLTEQRIRSWQDGQVVRLDQELDELALANVTQVIFSPETAFDRPAFLAATSEVLSGLFGRMTDATGLLSRLPTPSNRRFEAAATHLRDTIGSVIDSYRTAGEDRKDLLSMMVFATDEHGRPAMTDEQLHDEVITFFIAGSNTVANTLCWTLHELNQHPDVEKRLYEELDTVLGGRPAGYFDVRRLDYTRRTLTETLRVRTQGFFQSRVTTRETSLGGYRIPAGASVLYSFHALNHNPAIHREPERFDPDRWLPERASQIPRGAFIPFGTGVHGCIGEQFAWAEMIIVLAAMTGRWRFTALPGHTPRPKPALTMPVDSLPMVPHRRAGW